VSCQKDLVHEVLERGTGIEPATSSLGSWHSTAELPPPARTSNQKLLKNASGTLKLYRSCTRLVQSISDGRLSCTPNKLGTCPLAPLAAKNFLLATIFAELRIYFVHSSSLRVKVSRVCCQIYQSLKRARVFQITIQVCWATNLVRTIVIGVSCAKYGPAGGVPREQLAGLLAGLWRSLLTQESAATVPISSADLIFFKLRPGKRRPENGNARDR
jgi:hypothetical protein